MRIKDIIGEGRVIRKLPSTLYHGGAKAVEQFTIPAHGAYFTPHLAAAQNYGTVITAASVGAKKIYKIDYSHDVDDEIIDALFDRDYQAVADFIAQLQAQGFDAMQTITDSEMVVVFPGTPIQVIKQ